MHDLSDLIIIIWEIKCPRRNSLIIFSKLSSSVTRESAKLICCPASLTAPSALIQSPPSELSSPLKLITSMARSSRIKFGIRPARKDSEPSPTRTIEEHRELSSFTTLPKLGLLTILTNGSLSCGTMPSLISPLCCWETSRTWRTGILRGKLLRTSSQLISYYIWRPLPLMATTSTKHSKLLSKVPMRLFRNFRQSQNCD